MKSKAGHRSSIHQRLGEVEHVCYALLGRAHQNAMAQIQDMPLAPRLCNAVLDCCLYCIPRRKQYCWVHVALHATNHLAEATFTSKPKLAGRPYT